MSDLALIWDSTRGAADLAIVDNDLALDDGLETSVMLSLFTDRRAGDERGWWGNIDGDEFGSRLWQLVREKDTAAVLLQVPEIVQEALAWMVEDQVASRVECTATSMPITFGRSMLAITVTIHRPLTVPAVYRYSYNWESQEMAHAV